jgi:methionyl-tRNA synthetase
MVINMVTKIEIIPREIKQTYCDTCGSAASNDNWMYTCDVCGKDICEKCAQHLHFSDGTYLMLCEDCTTKDFTEYTKAKQEWINLDKQLDKKREEMDRILEKMK